MNLGRRQRSPFTLLELLVVIATIGVLAGLLLPALGQARAKGKAVACLSNLHQLGIAMHGYVGDFDGSFWPYRQAWNRQWLYFWGLDADPVDRSAAPLLAYLEHHPEAFLCPELPWGSYVPQGRAKAPTTAYGYNCFGLRVPGGMPTIDPATGKPRPPRRAEGIAKPAEFFIFADAAMRWKVGGQEILQNSSYLEPVTGNPMQMPTNHFRHGNKTHALCADGHAAGFDPEGWPRPSAPHRLGFVGTANDPHYDQ
ncbi:MAG: prepilin-type N-terminal cleavage/methylation domain-containing protein [Lentisphaeria bacterium]|jgi:prepilin-type processing-associated H-X9-DG protein